MKFEIGFTDSEARTIEFYLRRRYGSKANISKLAKLAIRREVADQAQRELDKAEGRPERPLANCPGCDDIGDGTHAEWCHLS